MSGYFYRPFNARAKCQPDSSTLCGWPKENTFQTEKECYEKCGTPEAQNAFKEEILLEKNSKKLTPIIMTSANASKEMEQF